MFNMNTASKHLQKGVTNPLNIPSYPPPKPGQTKTRTCPNCQEKLPIDRKCGCESFELINPNTYNNDTKENLDPNNKVEKIDPCKTEEYLLLQKQYQDEKNEHQKSGQKIETLKNENEILKNEIVKLKKQLEELDTLENKNETLKNEIIKQKKELEELDSLENENETLQDEIIKLKKELEETNTKDLRISNLEQRVQRHKELSSVALLQVEQLQTEMDEKNKQIEELKLQINKINENENKNKLQNDDYIQNINILTKDIYKSLNQKGESDFPYKENDINDVYPINTVDLSEGTSIEIDSFDNIDNKNKQNVMLLQSSNDNSTNNNSNDGVDELRKAFNVLQNKLNSKEKDVQNLKSNQFIMMSTNVELKEENEKMKNDIFLLNNKLDSVTKSLNLATKEFTNYKLQYNDQLNLDNEEEIDQLQKANANLMSKIEDLNRNQSQLLSKFNEQLKDTQSKLNKANDELNNNVLELNKYRKKEYEEKHTFVCPMCKERCKNEYSMIIEKCGHKLCWRTKNDCIRAYAKNIYRQSKQPHCYECKNLKQKTTIIPELQLELVLSEKEMEEYHKLVCLHGHLDNNNNNNNHNHRH